MTDIQWEDPPEDARLSGTTRGQYEELAIALRKRSGDWARLPGKRTESTAAAWAQNARRGKVKGFKAGEYECAVLEAEVWVRYIGPKDEAEEEEAPVTAFGPAVRAWARENGREVPKAGRLPDELVQAYVAATGIPDPRPRVVR